MTPLHLLITFATSLIVNLAATPAIIYVAHRNRWYDEKNHRKIHTEDVPRIGGIGIFLGFVAAAIVAGVVSTHSLAGVTRITESRPEDLILRLLPALLGVTLIHLLGLVDDFRDLRAVLKLVIQIAAATIVALGPWRIDQLTIPLLWYTVDLGVFAVPVTILWIVAVSNALNFIDGVDSLAGGNAGIATIFFAVIAFLAGEAVTGLLAVGLLGSIVGFLVFNAPPARIFMGDSGSYVLGFVLSIFPLMLNERTGSSLNLIPAITILGIPLLDVTTSVFRRLRRGQHPFSADREHLHHKLMDLGLETWSILGLTYGASAFLGIVAVSWYLLPPNLGTALNIGLWAVCAALMTVLSRIRGHT